MKRFIISFFTIALLWSLQAGLLNAKDPMKTFEGTWKFSAEQAPYGYQSGTMTFEIKDQKLTGYLMFSETEYKIPFENIEINDGGIALEITVDYEQIPIKGTIKDDVFSGIAESSQGPVSFTAKRVTEEKE